MEYDEQSLYRVAPPEYGALPEYRSSPPEYVTPQMTDPNLYTTQIKAAEPTHFFDFPHITQCPLPTNVFFFGDNAVADNQWSLTWGMQNPVQAQRLPQTSQGPQPIVYQRIPQRNYEDLAINVQKPLMSAPGSILQPSGPCAQEAVQHPRDVYIAPGSTGYDKTAAISSHADISTDHCYLQDVAAVAVPTRCVGVGSVQRVRSDLRTFLGTT